MLQWNDLHPYNAVHVVRISTPLDLERLKKVIAKRLEHEKLAALTIDRRASTYQFHDQPASAAVQVLGPDASFSSGFAQEIERQLNTPFVSGEAFSPFRFFVSPERDSFSLGLVYFHPLADAECSLILLQRIVKD